MKHIPCLLAEVLELMNPKPGECFVDCTLGAGAGHSQPIAKALGSNGRLVGIDLDPSAISSASEILKTINTPFTAHQGNFADIQAILADVGIHTVDGILADLGFSSDQMEDDSRGFSFASDALLDMRLNPSSDNPSALTLVNTLEESELADLFWKYGEEKLSRRIARAIVRERQKGQVKTCRQLAQLVESIYPKGVHRIHQSTRVFMSLRIAVNRELENLERFLPQALNLLRMSGRLGVITYHSKEVALVKRFFRRFAGQCVCPPGMPICGCGAVEQGRILTGSKSLTPTDAERDANRRSRSAQLRVIERIR